MNLLCIDPGPKVSGVICIDTETKEVTGTWGAIDNELFLKQIPFIHAKTCDHLAFEMIANMGMQVGASVFETVLWSGRFMEAFGADRTDRVYRKDVKMEMCGTTRAKDKNIRLSILDQYEPAGGGATPQVGTKSKPGPLYGVNKHAWSALAVGLTWIQQREVERWKQRLGR